MIVYVIPDGATLVWNYLITIGYSTIAFLVFYMATDWQKPGLWRAKNVAFAVALLMFDTGKTRLLFDLPVYSWTFMLGHTAFIVFGLLKFYLWLSERDSD